MSRCIVALEISAEAYEDIRKRVIASGYGDLIIKGPGMLSAAGSNEAINLDGIAIIRERPKQPRHARINGKYVDVSGLETLTFASVVELAGMKGHPSIIWRVAGESARESGTLLPGAWIATRDGMIIDCVHTGNA